MASPGNQPPDHRGPFNTLHKRHVRRSAVRGRSNFIWVCFFRGKQRFAGHGTSEDTTLEIEASGVLENDSDADEDSLTAILVEDVENGTLVLNADGSFTYTPDEDFNGGDSFTYKANDGEGDGNTVTVFIGVSPVADVCEDESDNDEDGLTDFPSDPGCSSATDDDETDAPPEEEEEEEGDDEVTETGGGGGGIPSLIGGGGAPGFQPGSVLGAFAEGDEEGGASTEGEVLGATTSELAQFCLDGRLLTSNLGMGKNNPPEQVKLLQQFLNQELGLSIPVTGAYGPMTLAAVNQFQAKYADEILAPWGLTQPTGYVGILTRYMIDKLVCGASYPKPDVSAL